MDEVASVQLRHADFRFVLHPYFQCAGQQNMKNVASLSLLQDDRAVGKLVFLQIRRDRGKGSMLQLPDDGIICEVPDCAHVSPSFP
jgi:hypothetical protein